MRLAVKMATAMVAAAKVVAMTAAAAPAVTATVATLGDRKVRHGQRRGENNGGNSQYEF
jgi:Spy/CpxP family protein refolding chaperone